MKIWECIILLSGLLRSAPIGTSPKRQFKAASSGPVLAKSKHNARGIRKMASSIRPHIDLSPQLDYYQKKSNPAQGTIGNSVGPLSPPPQLGFSDHTQRLKLPTGMHLYHPRNNDHAKSDESDQFSKYDDSDIKRIFEKSDDMLPLTSVDYRFPESWPQEASVNDEVSKPPPVADASSKRIVSLDEFADSEEVNHFQRKFEE